MVSDSIAISAPQPRALDLGTRPGARRALLGGPPQTAGMRAGIVVLAPGAAVGRHDTGAREEVIVVLEGCGEVRVAGAPALAVGVDAGAYVPPAREHDVVNTGEGPLRYLYVVASAPGAEGAR